jgi:hypothetical protein
MSVVKEGRRPVQESPISLIEKIIMFFLQDWLVPVAAMDLIFSGWLFRVNKVKLNICYGLGHVL